MDYLYILTRYPQTPQLSSRPWSFTYLVKTWKDEDTLVTGILNFDDFKLQLDRKTNPFPVHNSFSLFQKRPYCLYNESWGFCTRVGFGLYRSLRKGCLVWLLTSTGFTTLNKRQTILLVTVSFTQQPGRRSCTRPINNLHIQESGWVSGWLSLKTPHPGSPDVNSSEDPLRLPTGESTNRVIILSLTSVPFGHFRCLRLRIPPQ